MKIVIFGATGTIGQAVTTLLSERHEIIKIGYSNGDYKVDIGSKAAIKEVFEKIGMVDAIVSATGKVAFKTFDALTDDDWELGFKNKLLGQINVAQVGSNYLNNNGSITLTSGIISERPIAYGLAAATVNGALEHFVQAASLELPNKQRINIVSPTMLTESLDKYEDFFPGFIPIDGKCVAQYYKRSILGVENGQVIRAFNGA
ncbi:short chain dehydrogenase [Shewanella sp. OPT22]|nr:short chain dehydrogenase [Shewanella sp. OPT22]